MATAGEGASGADGTKVVLPFAVDRASFKETDVPLDNYSTATASASDVTIMSTHHIMNERTNAT